MWPKEKEFANLLTKQKRKWQYPAPRFKLKNTTYRPDFYLPEENLYIEVVGTRQAYHFNKTKIIELRKTYPKIRFIVVDVRNNPYPYPRSIQEDPRFFSLQLPMALYNALKKIADEEKRSVGNVVKLAIIYYLKKRRRI